MNKKEAIIKREVCMDSLIKTNKTLISLCKSIHDIMTENNISEEVRETVIKDLVSSITTSYFYLDIKQKSYKKAVEEELEISKIEMDIDRRTEETMLENDSFENQSSFQKLINKLFMRG
ncbi:hypothetical protein OIV57_17510 [Burkholderia pseudomallei]|uniref:hypothetical protein n=1 Tax=Burkholderia pseudomallei TaxID=28450 RepID=UPI0021F6C161|nr:hypothetical protein [Burkholderia pseudomallei]MCV9913935.1 hypothetical protein [Burkholderia pseudomallei]MCW0071260.1 hypothetical protein [Burkholderia pseudomallei]